MLQLNYSFNISDTSTWSTGLIVFATIIGVIGLILLLTTIIWFITWIKYSWFHTNNSANLIGGQLSKLYLEKYGVGADRIKFHGTSGRHISHINIEPRYFYLSPYIVRNNTLTLHLLPWTYRRSSIYTLAMAMESTWPVSSSKSSRFNTFWWDFSRKISLIIILLPLIFAAIFALAPYLNWSGVISVNSNKISIVLNILGALMLIFYSLSQLAFYGKSRKEITLNLQGILAPKEIRAINFIFQVKFVYYLIRMIYEVLRFILQIIVLVESDK